MYLDMYLVSKQVVYHLGRLIGVSIRASLYIHRSLNISIGLYHYLMYKRYQRNNNNNNNYNYNNNNNSHLLSIFINNLLIIMISSYVLKVAKPLLTLALI